MDLWLSDEQAALQDAENRFLVHSYGKAGDPLLRARIAVGLGLPAKAIEILAGSNADLYGIDGLQLLLEQLIRVGLAADARTLLDRDELRRNPDRLGLYEGHDYLDRPWGYRLHAYDCFDLCASVAAGRYVGAAGAAERLRSRLRAQEEASRRNVQRSTRIVRAGEGMARHPPLTRNPIRAAVRKLSTTSVFNALPAIGRAAARVGVGTRNTAASVADGPHTQLSCN